MSAYIARRLLQGLIILFMISAGMFWLTRAAIGDPMSQYATAQNISAADKARIRAKLGLDQPMPIQYLRWLGLALQGDLGISQFSRQPVSELMATRLPMTLWLMVTAEIVIISASLIIGTISAVRQYSLLDNLITSFSFIGFSMPIFFIALGLILIFAVQFKNWGLPYLPTGADIWDFNNPVEMAKHLILPVASLAIIQIAGYTRFLRSSMLEVLSQDFIRTARAKGLAERAVLMRHALQNAALPLVTIIGLDIPFLLGGAIVTEQVFAWPGMGRLFWEYTQRSDYPVVIAVLMLVSAAVVIFQIITDVAYTFVDPRIRLS
ncbi:MAG: ABC transporter permease [Chloroflexi bacterium]|nr:ABC transporter permease [Chloroflexota bacterium]